MQYLSCVHPYMELLRLMRTARENSTVPACPVHFQFSGMDEIVSPRSVRVARERFGAEPEILPGCGHNWFTAEGKERIADVLNNLLRYE